MGPHWNSPAGGYYTISPKRSVGRPRPGSLGPEADQTVNEVIVHLAGQVGAEVEVTLEFETHVPDGVHRHAVHVVTENSRRLRFEDSGFEGKQPALPCRLVLQMGTKARKETDDRLPVRNLVSALWPMGPRGLGWLLCCQMTRQ